jgi:hypothetical protein
VSSACFIFYRYKSIISKAAPGQKMRRASSAFVDSFGAFGNTHPRPNCLLPPYRKATTIEEGQKSKE